MIGCKLPLKIPYTLEGYLTRKLPDKYQKDINLLLNRKVKISIQNLEKMMPIIQVNYFLRMGNSIITAKYSYSLKDTYLLQKKGLIQS